MTRKRRTGQQISRDEASSDEEATPDPGTWQKASDEEISRRKIVTVRKRRATPSASDAPAAFPKISLTKASAAPEELATETTGASATAAAQEPPADALAQFRPALGSWKCDSCLLRNKAEDDKCPACQTPKPTSGDAAAADAATASAANENPLAKFAAPPGSWKCKTCLLTNKAADIKCPACETPNPSADTSPDSNVKNAAEKSAFKFGVDAGADAPANTSPTFKFGVESVDASKAAPSFSFGSTPSSATGFSFGSSSANATMSSFSSIAAPESSEKSSFSFLSDIKDSSSAPSFQFSAATFAAASSKLPASKPAVVLKELEEPLKSGEEDEELVLKLPIQLYQVKEVKKGDSTKQSYVESGAGDLRLNQYKDAEGKMKARMVMRMDKTHRLALNAAVFKDMSFTSVGERYVRFTSIESDGKFETYLLKAKSKQDCTQLLDALERTKLSLE